MFRPASRTYTLYTPYTLTHSLTHDNLDKRFFRPASRTYTLYTLTHSLTHDNSDNRLFRPASRTYTHPLTHSLARTHTSRAHRYPRLQQKWIVLTRRERERERERERAKGTGSLKGSREFSCLQQKMKRCETFENALNILCRGWGRIHTILKIRSHVH